MTMSFSFVTLCMFLFLPLSPPQVHSKYRNTGASFTKAQQEFSSGVLTNRTVQTATASAVSSAAQGAFRGNQGM